MKRVLLLMVVVLMSATINCSAQSRRECAKQRDRVLQLGEEGRCEEAEIVIDSMLNIYPKNADMLHFKALYFIDNDDIASAIECYNIALDNLTRKNCINRALLLYFRAMLHKSQMDYDSAVRDCIQAIAHNKKSNVWLLCYILQTRAECYYYMGKYDMAESDLMQIVYMEDATECVDYALSCLCDLYLEVGDYESMIEYAELVIQRGSEYKSNAYASLIMANLFLDDKHTAIDYAMDMVLDPDVEVNENTARGIFLEELTYARSAIHKRIESDTENKYIYGHLEICKYVMDYDTMLILLTQLEDVYEREPMLRLLANCSIEAGRYEQAVTYITELIDVYSDHEYDYIMSRGDVFRYMGEYEKAIADIQHYMSLCPDDAYAYYTMGWCYQMMGDDAKAMEGYNKAISIDDTLSESYLSRGKYYLKVGDMESAKRDFERILQLDVEECGVLPRIYALTLLGRNEEALEHLDEMIKTMPYSYTGYYQAACIYALMGDVNQSLDNLRMALYYGFKSKEYICNDPDLDSIRHIDAFKSLMDEFFN